MTIVNIRFEPPIGFQTSGGPGWKSEIVRLASGAELRNALWALPLRKWQVMGIPMTGAEANTLMRFFNARSGALEGFRFRDPFGWSSAADGAISPADQALGTGDGVTQDFQLVLDDGGAIARPITRPVAGSVRIAIDGIETSAFAVDDTNGIVSFDVAPANGAVLTAGFEFDVPVRFESDTLELSQPGSGAFQLVRLSLLEVREGV